VVRDQEGKFVRSSVREDVEMDDGNDESDL